MFDTKCFELATSFLDDEKILTPANASDLAQHIQTSIEDWIEAKQASQIDERETRASEWTPEQTRKNFAHGAPPVSAPS